MRILNTVYGCLQMENHTRSRFELNEEEMSGSEATKAASSIHDELLLEGTPALSLADFATTYMGNEVEDPMLKKIMICPALWNLGWLVAEDENRLGGIPKVCAVPTWRI